MDTTNSFMKVIETSLKDRCLDKINSYFSSTNTADVLNAEMLSFLSELLMRNGKCEDKKMHADCVLCCLQHFVVGNFSADVWREAANNVGHLSSLLFVLSTNLIKDERFIEKNIVTFMDIVEQNTDVVGSMLHSTMNDLLRVSSVDTFSNDIKLLSLTLLSTMMEKTTREKRREIIPSTCYLLNDLSDSLPLCGDYELQMVTVEVLARSWLYIKDQTELFTNCPHVRDLFKRYTFVDLDNECRLFLNSFNNTMGDGQKVFSIPCLVITDNGICYKKPKDPNYKKFWVDFNVNPKSISFYHQSSPNSTWELMRYPENKMLSIKAENSQIKSKGGELIKTVKLVIIIQEDDSSTEKTKMVKIYFRLGKEYAKVEKEASHKIFQEKYKSEVTYEEIDTPQDKIKSTSSTKMQPKANEVKPDGETVEQTMIPHVTEWLDESKESVKVSTLHTEGSLVALPQHKDNTSTSVRKRSDSFSEYIKSLLEEEEQMKGRNKRMIKPGNIISEVRDVNKKQNKTYDDSSVHSEGNTVIITNTPDKQLLKGKETNCISLSKQYFCNNDNNSCHVKLGNCGTYSTNSRKSLPDAHKLSKRKRLFSSENENENKFMMSSQEDLSPEMPIYKLEGKKDQLISPILNIEGMNCAPSKINESNKHARKHEAYHPQLYLDTEREDDRENSLQYNVKDENSVRNQKDESTLLSFQNLSFGMERKLLELNKTPESVERSKLFSPTFESSFEADTHHKRTYTRPKPNKRRRKSHTTLVDGDSDYCPSVKLSPSENNIPYPTRKMVNKCDQIVFSNVDPLQNTGDESELEQENSMEIDHSEGVPNKCGEQQYQIRGRTHKAIPKKSLVKGKKGRKPRGKKVLSCAKILTKDDFVAEQNKIKHQDYNPPKGNIDVYNFSLDSNDQITEDGPTCKLPLNHYVAKTDGHMSNKRTPAQEDSMAHSYFTTFQEKLKSLAEEIKVISDNVADMQSLFSIGIQKGFYKQFQDL